ncbi:MAG TPA: hypothetical protein VN516_10020, partial [Candidatus Baltobacteraceae bacterium]|nr:hypothetical protein [Candidatus Baltobacteraceae bacterium]
KLQFVYVDASSKQKYTIIRVEKVTVADNWHKGYYCLLPLTIPLDIATSPFQLIYFGAIGLAMENGHT